MRHGTYVRGWRYDWQEVRKDYERLLDVGRDAAAAFWVDPGCTSCPVCGEMHWNEFEVYLCGRCGAEVDVKTGTAGPPAKPDMVRKTLFDGMRVRFVSHDIVGINGIRRKRTGHWPAGNIPPGSVGTVVRRSGDESGLHWMVNFDGITPKPGYIFGVFGPFLDDDFEELERNCSD